jgi:ATP-dependent Lhr-like helicase
LISVSGADPLNLAGILAPGSKLPALTGNRILYRDGIPLALLQGNEMQLLQELDPRSEALARTALLRHAKASPLLHPLAGAERTEAPAAAPTS